MEVEQPQNSAATRYSVVAPDLKNFRCAAAAIEGAGGRVDEPVSQPRGFLSECSVPGISAALREQLTALNVQLHAQNGGDSVLK